MNKKFLPHTLSAAVAAATISTAAISQESALTLEEVVVTAQKREQSMQDVPIAVTAMDAAALRASGVDDVSDLNAANPSFTINVQQNKVSNSPARIRGIGTTGTNPAFEGAVGLYVDGVYRSRPGMVLATFNDIGQLQILRGPQGTLFGKNTSAGALILDSTMPNEETEAGVEVSLGNYNAQKYTVYANGAVTDNLVMRASLLHTERDGFVDNPYTGTNSQNVDTDALKVQALYTGETYTARIIADYTEADEVCCYAMAGSLDPAANAAHPLDAFYGSATNGAPWFDQTGDVFDRDFVNNSDAQDKSRDWGVSLDISTDLTDDMTLRSITAYREYKNDQQNGDWDFTAADLGADYRQLYEFETFTQEFNLTGHAELAGTGVEYILGAFYSNEDLHHVIEQGTGEFLGENFQIALPAPLNALPADQLAAPGTLFNNTEFDHNDEVMAFYGHFTFELSENLNAIVGVRYSEETKELDRTNLLASSNLEMANYMAANHVGLLALGAAYNGPSGKWSIDEEELTYTAGLQYFPTDDTQIYFNYSKGYKAGGISMNNDAGGRLVSIANLLAPPATEGDVVLSAETDPTYAPEFVDSYELGIKTEYQDGRGRLNLAVFHSEFEDIQAQTFTGTQFLTYNADTATTQGVELENTYALTENLTSTLSVTWLEEAKFGDEPNAFQPLLPGRDIEFAPELSGFLGLRYDNQISQDINLYSSLNISYTGEHNVTNDADYREEYTLVGAAVGVRLLQDALDVQLSCANCTDKDYITNIFEAPLQFHDALMANPGAPRTWQLSMSYRWY